MKHIHTFESFLNEGKMSIEQVIELLKKEMRWNNPTVEPVSDDDLKMYSHIKNLSKDNGIMYHGLPGESLIKDFKTIFNKHGIQATVNRGYETSRRADAHDYIIIIKVL
jgi:hypothetical protein